MFDSLTDTTPPRSSRTCAPQVHNFWDRGLLGIAVDPNFAANRYDLRSLYPRRPDRRRRAPRGAPATARPTRAPSPPGPTTDGCVVSGRLSRLTAAGADWTASEQVLIEDWCQQFPSHSVGALGFGADGYLYVSAGDGASFANQDWGQFGGTLGGPPPLSPGTRAAIRRFRWGRPDRSPTPRAAPFAARARGATAGEPRVLNGSILRVDPATGPPRRTTPSSSRAARIPTSSASSATGFATPSA